MEILAFLSVPAVAAIDFTPAKATEALPTFKPRWWYREDRLDARPVIWSLRNRPQDWKWETRDYTITHIPSKHTFWIANGRGYYALYETDGCSCLSSSRGKFQRFQQGSFGRAFKAWRRTQRPLHDPEHFAAHFVR